MLYIALRAKNRTVEGITVHFSPWYEQYQTVVTSPFSTPIVKTTTMTPIKNSVVFCVVATLLAIASSSLIPDIVIKDPPPYKELYFDQLLDHFNYNSFDVQTFKQRYLVSSHYWEPEQGPIFFYTGNEGSITSFYDNTGFVHDIAPMFRALVIFAEHRFYGKSLPAGPTKSFQVFFNAMLRT